MTRNQTSRRNFKSLATFGAAIAFAAFVPCAQALPFIANGDFSSNGGPGQVNFNTTITGWNVSPNPGYTFLFSSPLQAVTVADAGQYINVSLIAVGATLPNAGPNANASVGAFLAADPAFQGPNAISQTVTGLTSGAAYTLGFYWAGAEQFGYTGASNLGWTVTLGGSAAQSTTTVGPSGTWFYQSFTFIADGTSDLLQFLSQGGPSADQPPFVLLTDVSLTPAVPEPATWSLMLGGFGVLGFGILKSKNKKKR